MTIPERPRRLWDRILTGRRPAAIRDQYQPSMLDVLYGVFRPVTQS